MKEHDLPWGKEPSVCLDQVRTKTMGLEAVLEGRFEELENSAMMPSSNLFGMIFGAPRYFHTKLLHVIGMPDFLCIHQSKAAVGRRLNVRH